VLLASLAVPDYRGIESLRELILAATEAPVIVVSSAYDDSPSHPVVCAPLNEDLVAKLGVAQKIEEWRLLADSLAPQLQGV
jgi:hypothetical protein